MSSGDEFANYDPSTPAGKLNAAKKATVPNTNNNRSAAGPSTVAAKGSRTNLTSKASRKPPTKVATKTVPSWRNQREEDTGHIPDQILVISSDDENSIPASSKAKSSTRAANRKTAARAKGKANADPPPKPSRGPPETNTMEVDEIEEISHEDEIHALRTDQAIQSIGSKGIVNRQTRSQAEGSFSELPRVQKQLNEVTQHRNKLAQQFDDLLKNRTEAEALLEQQTAQYEVRLKTQETLIQELTSQLAKVKTLSGTGQSYMVQFLTREAADEERKSLDKEVARLKDKLKQKDAYLAEKDKRIAELEDREKVLQSDLKAEIDRGKDLVSRNPPPSVSRRTVASSSNDGKNADVVRLYEDMTNLLVLNVKYERSPYEQSDEPVFTCVYTSNGTAVPHSLSFNLKATIERIDGTTTPVTSKDELEAKIRFIPQNLENEPEEFITTLGFFKDPFMFARNQLAVFWKTLSERLGDPPEAGQDDDDNEEEEVMVVE